jgi:hypothetical protein
MNESDLGWLAGIIDGEGTITLCEVHKVDRQHLGFSVNVCVSSTSPKLIYRVMHLMEEMELKPAIQLLKGKGKRKDAYQARITERTRIELFLLRISPYLVEKKEQAYWMLEYIKQRRLEGGQISSLCYSIAYKIRSLNTKQGLTKELEGGENGK